MAVTNLSPYQLAIQAAAGKGKGAALSAAQLGQVADSVFGPAPITPGSRITYQDATTVRWIDADGFEHIAQRDLNGTNPAAGQWRTQTNRPTVMTDRGQQTALEALRARTLAGLTETPALANLD